MSRSRHSNNRKVVSTSNNSRRGGWDQFNHPIESNCFLTQETLLGLLQDYRRATTNTTSDGNQAGFEEDDLVQEGSTTRDYEAGAHQHSSSTAIEGQEERGEEEEAEGAGNIAGGLLLPPLLGRRRQREFRDHFGLLLEEGDGRDSLGKGNGDQCDDDEMLSGWRCTFCLRTIEQHMSSADASYVAQYPSSGPRHGGGRDATSARRREAMQYSQFCGEKRTGFGSIEEEEEGEESTSGAVVVADDFAETDLAREIPPPFEAPHQKRRRLDDSIALHNPPGRAVVGFGVGPVSSTSVNTEWKLRVLSSLHTQGLGEASLEAFCLQGGRAEEILRFLNHTVSSSDHQSSSSGGAPPLPNCFKGTVVDSTLDDLLSYALLGGCPQTVVTILDFCVKLSMSDQVYCNLTARGLLRALMRKVGKKILSNCCPSSSCAEHPSCEGDEGTKDEEDICEDTLYTFYDKFVLWSGSIELVRHWFNGGGPASPSPIRQQLSLFHPSVFRRRSAEEELPSQHDDITEVDDLSVVREGLNVDDEVVSSPFYVSAFECSTVVRETGAPLLFYAARSGSIQMLEFAISTLTERVRAQEVSSLRDDHGASILMHAAMSGSTDMMFHCASSPIFNKFTIEERGGELFAEPVTVMNFGSRSCSNKFCTASSKDGHGMTVTMYAACSNSMEAVRFSAANGGGALVIGGGDSSSAPMSRAGPKTNLVLPQVSYHQKNSRGDAIDNDGMTASMHAARCAAKAVVDFLREVDLELHGTEESHLQRSNSGLTVEDILSLSFVEQLISSLRRNVGGGGNLLGVNFLPISEHTRQLALSGFPYGLRPFYSDSELMKLLLQRGTNQAFTVSNQSMSLRARRASSYSRGEVGIWSEMNATSTANDDNLLVSRNRDRRSEADLLPLDPEARILEIGARGIVAQNGRGSSTSQEEEEDNESTTEPALPAGPSKTANVSRQKRGRDLFAWK